MLLYEIQYLLFLIFADPFAAVPRFAALARAIVPASAEVADPGFSGLCLDDLLHRQLSGREIVPLLLRSGSRWWKHLVQSLVQLSLDL